MFYILERKYKCVNSLYERTSLMIAPRKIERGTILDSSEIALYPDIKGNYGKDCESFKVRIYIEGYGDISVRDFERHFAALKDGTE